MNFFKMLVEKLKNRIKAEKRRKKRKKNGKKKEKKSVKFLRKEVIMHLKVPSYALVVCTRVFFGGRSKKKI